MLALFVLSLILPLIPVPVHAVANWYDTSWLYRKSISINGTTAGVQTNYSLLINVMYGAGTDGITTSGNATVQGIVYVNGKCQTDFDDIRFTKSDGITLLDQYTEYYTASSTARIWVEFDYLAASPTQNTFYIYYGNSSATSVSNGANTFVKFEGFEWSTNATTLSTSGGSVTWSQTTAGTSKAEISTTQYYWGTRSGRLYRDGANNPIAQFTQTAGNTIAIRYRVRKSNTATLDTYHGNGTSLVQIGEQSDEDIYYVDSAPAQIDTGENATILTWEVFEYNNFNWISKTVDIYFNNNKIENSVNVGWAIGAYSNQIAFGISEDTSEFFIDDIIVKKWSNPEPIIADWGSEEYFAVGSYLAIQDVKIFESYKGSGDWLFTIRYLNLYPPYYDTYDIKQYFCIRLLNLSGTEIARTAVPVWGNKVGCVYLAASQVTALNWGSAYTVQIYGTFTGNPYTAYTLTSTDWIGTDLTLLDSWVITSAGVIGTYYSTTLTTNISTRGEVLNSDGASVFNLGIPGLMIVRPNLFQISSIAGTGKTTTYVQTNRSSDWQSKIGPKATSLLTNMGSFINVDGRTIGVILCIILMVILAAFCLAPNHTMASNALTVPILAIGIGLLLFDQALIAVIFLLASVIVLWQVVLNKGG